MRMLAGAILFLSAVAMMGIVVFREEHLIQSGKAELLLTILTLGSFLVGAFALLLVISGFVEELNHQRPDPPTQS